jgi:hypothetical protein
MISEVMALVIANWVFFVGGIAFTVALIPSLLKKETSIPVFSSSMTAGFLWAYAVVDGLLGLWEALAAGASTALIWTLLLMFRRPKRVK